MEKFMKFPMYKKETTDEKYHNDRFRAVNFKTDEAGNLVCPNGKKFRLAYRRTVKGNLYGGRKKSMHARIAAAVPMRGNVKRPEAIAPFS